MSSAQRRLTNHKIKRENAQGRTSPARGVLAGKLPPSGRLNGAAVSHREGHDLGGTGGNLRSAGEQCRELAGSPGEAAHVSLVRPVLCRESREAAGGGRAAERANASATWLGVRPLDAVLTADRNHSAFSGAHFSSQSRDRRGSLIISRQERPKRVGPTKQPVETSPIREDEPAPACRRGSFHSF